ncbi:hypothetical protein [Singulisphaera acidiphila]|uniref:Outer membrane protein n=1 Tax=Singulisphaera acidiphila (strain ATCC BAA-1392 / DSM 18658 / VKM B-2454 / MOB10) TaxID=886293 RepID=L0DIJ2_SINAD|nr:hypothetical protein [Singulisphaera acidiphila]AGA29077.1 hypothetical protein Sinac_4921 [Singulisphaera acidiphila DSM 18658]
MLNGSGLVRKGATLLLLIASGCAHPPHRRPGGCGPLPRDAPTLAIPPVVERGEISLDLTRLAPFATLETSLSRERNTVSTYRALSARDCLCLAARASSVGNLLDQKANQGLEQAKGTGPLCDEVKQTRLVQEGMLRDAALEARNRSAGAALELFYNLAESEGRLDVLKQSLAEIEETLATGERMKAKGMQLGDDFEILRRQRVATLNSNIELDLAIERLNAELQHRLQLGPTDERWRIWPVVEQSVVADPIDVPAAVVLGLERRPSLLLLRRLGQSLDRENAPIVRRVIGQVHALLELSSQDELTGWKVLISVFKRPQASDREVQELCRQLQAYRIEHERSVAEEIRQDVMIVAARLRQVAVVREEVDGWDRRLDELKAKAERGISTFPERTTVQLRRFEAQGSLIEKVMAWNIARGHLAEHQGILIDGCGPTACPLLAAPGPG